MRICLFFFVCLILSFGYGCDVIPPEGTIIYDIEFPPADSCEAQGNCGGGGGGGGGSQALKFIGLGGRGDGGGEWPGAQLACPR
mgnify:CR=1 FL=1